MLFTETLAGQVSNSLIEIEGQVVNAVTKQPVAYANIFNKTTQKGTISNLDGYFKISVKSLHDSVLVTFIGFRKKQILLDRSKYYTVLLQESVQLLSEVTVVAPDNSFLYKLLDECRKNAPKDETAAKAYYELRSYAQDKQIELVEAFFNAEMIGYDLTALKLKAGRLALQPYNDRLFTSQESSRAITKYKLSGNNPYFPQSPLELPKSKMKKQFYLELNKKYQDDKLDSVYIIDFSPKHSSGSFFKGKIWINTSRKHIVKINLRCNNSGKHPFLPLFPTDSIANVDFDITKTYREIEGKPAFDHIDFIYATDYLSRIGGEKEFSYHLTTQALLYAYDYDNVFLIPEFQFSDENIGDYRKISAMPYNDFFWKMNDEFRLNDQKNANEQFFDDNNSITNKALFSSNRLLNTGILEHPYIFWSDKRILFREFIADTSEDKISGQGFKSEQYNLSVKVFMDVNTYAGTTDMLSATVFDPYESYYRLPLDNAAHCFINIYFDLVEIERRKFEIEVENSDKSPGTIQHLYNNLLERLEMLKQPYFKSVERGTRQDEMLKWNKIVVGNLGIDNLEIFGSFDDKKP